MIWPTALAVLPLLAMVPGADAVAQAWQPVCADKNKRAAKPENLSCARVTGSENLYDCTITLDFPDGSRPSFTNRISLTDGQWTLISGEPICYSVKIKTTS